MVGSTDRERMTRRLGEPDRLGLVLGRLGESAELGEAHNQPEAIVDRGGSAASKGLVDPIRGGGRPGGGGQGRPPLRPPPGGPAHARETAGAGAELPDPPAPPASP